MTLGVQVMTSPGSAGQGRGHRGVAAWARDVIVRSLTEVEGVFSIKALAGHKADDGGAECTVPSVDSRQDGGGKGVAVRGGAGNMGRVGGWGIVFVNLPPHVGLGIVVSGEAEGGERCLEQGEGEPVSRLGVSWPEPKVGS